MIRTVYANAALIDTSAVVALHDPEEQFHKAAKRFYSSERNIEWATLDVTSHECFTLIRYKRTFQAAMEHYSFLRNAAVKLLSFKAEDELSACTLLRKYSEHSLSFHDALCAVVMKRIGIYQVFTFDRHFAILGFQTLPGVYERRPQRRGV